MHEFSLLSDLMKKIDLIALEHRSRRIRRVTVWLGAMSNISPDHFREHFELASRATVADGAKLEIEVGDDLRDPKAQEIILKSVELEE